MSFGMTVAAHAPTNEQQKIEKETLQKELESLQLKIEAAKSDASLVVSHKAEIEALTKQKKELEETIKDLEANNTQVSTNSANLKAAHETTERELQKLIVKYNEVEDNTIKREQDSKKADDHLQDTLKLIETAKIELSAIEERLGLYKDLEALKNAVVASQTTKNAIDADIKTLETTKTTLKDEVDVLQADKTKADKDAKESAEKAATYAAAVKDWEEKEKIAKGAAELAEAEVEKIKTDAKQEADTIVAAAKADQSKQQADYDKKAAIINQRVGWIQNKERKMRAALKQLEEIHHKPILGIDFGEDSENILSL